MSQVLSVPIQLEAQPGVALTLRQQAQGEAVWEISMGMGIGMDQCTPNPQRVAIVEHPPQSNVVPKILQTRSGPVGVLQTGDLLWIALPGGSITLGDGTRLTMLGETSAHSQASSSTAFPTAGLSHSETPQPITHQAMILGAGLASRLYPLAGEMTGVSKPCVPLIGDDSVIVTMARHLVRHGFKTILVNTYYQPERLKSQLRSVSSARLTFIDESSPSGTAGGLVKALEQELVDPGQPILVVQGDSVTNVNLSALVLAHQAQASLATVGVQQVSDESVSKLAIVVTDQSGEDGQSGWVQQFWEKPSLSQAGDHRLGSIGFYVLSPAIFSDVMAWGRQQWQASGEFDYALHLFPKLLQQLPGSVYAQQFPQPFYWSDIGTPQQYAQTLGDVYAGCLGQPLPENLHHYFEGGVIYWHDARQRAAKYGARLSGSIIVMPVPDSAQAT